ncbi:unnamed protein product [Paramecium primaurelia]|uniref:Protein kinase domain-containing protein n=1 Tax=Paramecium primaurelia TaxID=5886 RepID=A0A8S1JUE1_PARPR|nr:unnamed protein product [Paramecium primaurelia]
MQQDLCKVGQYFQWDQKKVLGEGRISVIYQGLNSKDNSIIAIKKFRSDLLQNKNFYLRELLKQEELLLRMMQPENFIKCIALEETQNSVYWITELAETSLRQEMIQAENGKLKMEQVINLCKNLLDGYLFLINQNVLHQDIKPEGILKKNNQYYYSDLGNGYMISRFQGENNQTNYQSPQKTLNQIYTGKCDIWSIGIILYECLSGSVPIIHNNETQIAKEFTDAYQNEPIYDFIIQCIKYSESERLSWEQVYSHPFVINQLDIKVDVKIEQSYTAFKEQFLKTTVQVNLYLMIGMNSESDNTERLTKQEFIQSAKKQTPNSSSKEINSLFYEIAGFKATHITNKDINNWQNRVKNRLKGDRGYHYQLMSQEQTEQDNQLKNLPVLKWTINLDKKRLKNVSLLYPEVVEIILSIKASMNKFNTKLDDLFNKYDPNKIGGITKQQLDKIIMKMYPEGRNDVVMSHVFQFINQFQNGKISKEEFQFCIFDLDLQEIIKKRN